MIGTVFACFLIRERACARMKLRMQGKVEKGYDVKKTLMTLLVICCSTVVYATSVSVMITAPQIATTSSIAVTPTSVSEILTVVYGEYPQVFGKSGVDYTTNALSASFQQVATHSIAANIGSESVGDTPTSDPTSPTPVPEPNALLLVGIGLAGLGIALRLRR